MMHGCLKLAENKNCVIPRVARTSNILERMKGLLGSPPLNSDEALLIKPCSSIHTFAMQYPIDLVFLDHQWKVIKTVANLRPWRIAAAPAAGMVLELPVGSLERLQLTEGQQLEWHDGTVQ
jgi:uncharacterized membrane protein (UPF0127 family)